MSMPGGEKLPSGRCTWDPLTAPRSQQGRSRAGSVAGCSSVACGLFGAVAVSHICIRSRNLYSKQDVQMGRAAGSSGALSRRSNRLTSGS